MTVDCLTWLRAVWAAVEREHAETPDDDTQALAARVAVERHIVAGLAPLPWDHNPRELLVLAHGWRWMPGYQRAWRPDPAPTPRPEEPARA